MRNKPIVVIAIDSLARFLMRRSQYLLFVGSASVTALVAQRRKLAIELKFPS
ncbi:MAG: hypothetical protein JGK24_11475 [Microcoleus sp. PH2017_29_MFU_D_A]|jgi:hypothetical protein|uniref:hypothetical protein n=1 Tax=unclassified Microcoleus TaxID=2642155 RepID=UPI001DD5E31B|nr:MULTISPECIES: hypothetical protein [unclassified Microcoleus]MCC3433413.1 hypothetical protein [Microcoleus sp. PH2017_04_SCI_O_A]MCC3442468.1 hypothetical protein [Microcoleus sp. PH2017_03_ELD_O_A]MCC3469199.1 hypothetical protein [Microcoleus sp. PH2017_06_SFM_O_A]MCC3503674.1 hypothetical protein [Microcoleus sp. PH2017_19_SFW_U_A]MCC3511391.1 hypothetical protein [Microcoleus sp. PH2017_17_BER_D_A]